MAEDQQSALGREHANAQIGVFRNLLAPDARGIDHHFGMNIVALCRLMVENAHPGNAIASAKQTDHLMIGEDLRTVLTGVEHIGGGETEGIDSAVRHPHRTDQSRVGRRLQTQRQLWVDRFGVDTGAVAGGNKLLLIGQRILRQRNKQPIGTFDAVVRNTLEDLVFFYAFMRRLTVGHRIACSTVQQAVVTASGTGGNIVTLQQYATQATARAVTSNARTGRAAANNDHIRFVIR
ncbi:hypothetical protein D3C81_1353640 [compost metagenome]